MKPTKMNSSADTQDLKNSSSKSDTTLYIEISPTETELIKVAIYTGAGV